MPTTTDLIGLAIDKNPVDFADTFNTIMMQKAADAINVAHVETAQSMYGQAAGETEAADEVDEFEDIEDADDTEEDFDFDTDDLDLDDLDIEDFADAEDTE